MHEGRDMRNLVIAEIKEKEYPYINSYMFPHAAGVSFFRV